MSPQPQGCLVLLNGFPGTGKLAIARALHSELREARVETTLVDNHLVIDLAEAVYLGRGAEHRALVDRLRRVVLDELKVLPKSDAVLIMTVCLGDNDVDGEVFGEYVDIARFRNIPCYAFTISCDREEHMRRLQAPDRINSGKTKLSDPAVPETMLADNKILDPTDHSSGYGFDVDVLLRHEVIDSTGLSVEESASQIMNVITAQPSKDDRDAHVGSELAGID